MSRLEKENPEGEAEVDRGKGHPHVYCGIPTVLGARVLLFLLVILIEHVIPLWYCVRHWRHKAGEM